MGQLRQNKFDILLEKIGNDILSGKFHPRERLIEADLIERYGATRAAIRKALKELEIKHLVEYVPNRGAMVSAPDSAEMVDIFQARLALESFSIAQILIPVPAETLAMILQSMETYENAVQVNDLRAQHDSNRMFHHTILLLCGNSLIADMVDKLKYRSHFWVGRPDRFDHTVLEHRALYNALEKGALEELNRLNTEHLTKGYEHFLADQA